LRGEILQRIELRIRVFLYAKPVELITGIQQGHRNNIGNQAFASQESK
jgi:hypothetical protein